MSLIRARRTPDRSPTTGLHVVAKPACAPYSDRTADQPDHVAQRGLYATGPVPCRPAAGEVCSIMAEELPRRQSSRHLTGDSASLIPVGAQALELCRARQTGPERPKHPHDPADGPPTCDMVDMTGLSMRAGNRVGIAPAVHYFGLH